MYIWEKEIKSVKAWLVEYVDWTTELFSEEYAKYFTTEKATTLDEFSLKKRHKMISDIMKIFIDGNAELADIESVHGWLISSIDNAKDDAIAKLFDVSHPSNINFKAINDIVLGK